MSDLDPSHASGLRFRALERTDLPLLASWFARPHVARWWPEPRGEAAVDREYGAILGGSDPTEAFILEAAARAIGLFQRYRHAEEPAWERTVGVPRAIGIDYLIGEPEALRRGIGSAALALFAAEGLRAHPDLEVVCAVPQQANVASWRALERAGFERQRAVARLDSDDPGDSGPAFVYVRGRQAPLTP